jgi:Spy/CpxP family protein refolding chaperone
MDLVSKNKLLFVIIGILIILNILSIGAMWLFKFKGPHPPPPMQMNQPPKDGKMFLKEELKLSAEQTEQFEKLRDEHFIKINTIQEEIRKLKDDMYNLLVSKYADSVKAPELAGKISDKQKEIELATFNHFRKLRDICSDEQKAKFDILLREMLKNMGPMHNEHPENFPPGPPPEHHEKH